MAKITRRKFLKIAGTGIAGSVVGCGCSPRAALAPSITAATATSQIPTPTEKARTIIHPDKAAYICGCKPDVHNPGGGGNTQVYIGNYCKESERFLMHWDVSILPFGLKIEKAVLGLFCLEIYGKPSGRVIYAPVTASWDETVTYNNQPEHADNLQKTMEWPGKGKWQEVDISEMANQWIAAPDKNHGLIGYAVEVDEDTASAVFASIQNDEEYRPRIIIT
jgi:hypothetical protein